MVMDDPTLPRIKVRDLLMQAFLTFCAPTACGCTTVWKPRTSS